MHAISALEEVKHSLRNSLTYPNKEYGNRNGGIIKFLDHTLDGKTEQVP